MIKNVIAREDVEEVLEEVLTHLVDTNAPTQLIEKVEDVLGPKSTSAGDQIALTAWINGTPIDGRMQVGR